MKRSYHILLYLTVLICAFQVSCTSGTGQGATGREPEVAASPVSGDSGAEPAKDVRDLPTPEEVCRIPGTNGVPVPGSFRILGGGRYIVYSVKDPNDADKHPVWMMLDREGRGQAKRLWALAFEALRQPKRWSYSLCRSSDPNSNVVALISDDRAWVEVFDVEKKTSGALGLGGSTKMEARRRIRGACVLSDSWLITMDIGMGSPTDRRWFTGRQPHRVKEPEWGDWGLGSKGIIVGACQDGKTLAFVRPRGGDTKQRRGTLGPVDLELLLVAEEKVIKKLELKRVVGHPTLDPAGKYVAFVTSRPTAGREVVVRAIHGSQACVIAASGIVGMTSTTVVVRRRRARSSGTTRRAEIAVFSFDGTEIGVIPGAETATVSGNAVYFYLESTKRVMRVRTDPPG